MKNWRLGLFIVIVLSLVAGLVYLGVQMNENKTNIATNNESIEKHNKSIETNTLGLAAAKIDFEKKINDNKLAAAAAQLQSGINKISIETNKTSIDTNTVGLAAAKIDFEKKINDNKLAAAAAQTQSGINKILLENLDKNTNSEFTKLQNSINLLMSYVLRQTVPVPGLMIGGRNPPLVLAVKSEETIKPGDLVYNSDDGLVRNDSSRKDEPVNVAVTKNNDDTFIVAIFEDDGTETYTTINCEPLQSIITASDQNYYQKTEGGVEKYMVTGRSHVRFLDFGGASANYGDNQKVQWIFDAGEGEGVEWKIKIHKYEVAGSTDFMWVASLDGDGTNQSHVSALSTDYGSHQNFTTKLNNNLNDMDEVVSKQRYLVFQFESDDDQKTAAGWDITLTSTKTVGSTLSENLPLYVDPRHPHKCKLGEGAGTLIGYTAGTNREGQTCVLAKLAKMETTTANP